MAALCFAVFIAGDIAQQSSISISDSNLKETNKTINGINVTEVKNETVIDYAGMLVNRTEMLTLCDKKNDTKAEIEVYCINYTLIVTQVDKTRGEPIYSYSDVQAIVYKDVKYDFDTKGCFVCKNVNSTRKRISFGGDLLLCFSKLDGYSPYRAEEFKCMIRDGESAIVIDLETDSKLYEVSDVGKI